MVRSIEVLVEFFLSLLVGECVPFGRGRLGVLNDEEVFEFWSLD